MRVISMMSSAGNIMPSAPATFLVLQGIGEYDFVPLVPPRPDA